MSVRRHLSEFHKTAAEHHAKMAATHEAISKCFGGLTKATKSAGGDDMSKAAADLATRHGDLAAHHTAHAAYHEDACEKCEKAVDGVDLEKSTRLAPSAISAVTPNAPPAHLRAVPRVGQPNVTAPATLEPGLSKLFAIDGEQEEELFAKSINARRDSPHDLSKIG
jgi:hypothetical protein